MGRNKNKQPEPLLNIGSYCADSSGILSHREQTQEGGSYKTEIIANHTPIATRYVKRTDGFTCTEKVEFRTVCNGVRSAPVEVDRKTILSTQPHLLFDMKCRILPGRGHVAKYSECMQMQCESIPVTTLYAHTGWHVSPDGKDRVFLNGDYSISAEGLTEEYGVELDPDFRNFRFVDIEDADEECFKTAWDDFRAIMPSEKSIPLLAYVFLSPLNEMLRSIGKEPCFSLYIVGQSGSYKSSIAKLLLNYFGVFSYSDPAPCSFNDTPGSIGRKLGVGADIPLLIDDRRPSQSADRAKFETAEKYISSAIGDRAFRGRLNSDGTAKKSYIPRCNLIVTAEEAFQNVGSSSIARAVTVTFDKDTINFKAMQNVQDNAERLNRVMQLYLQWVIKNYNQLKKACPVLLKEYREVFENTGHARLATAFSHLLLGYRIFLQFLQDNGVIDSVAVKKEIKTAISCFTEMSLYQNKLVEGDSPTAMFIEAVKNITLTQPMRILQLTEHGTHSNYHNGRNEETIGYKDDKYYYLIPATVMNAVIDFYRRGDYAFPASKISLQKALLRENLVVPVGSGNKARADVKVTINKRQVRCWRIPCRYIDNSEGDDTDE